MVVVLVGGDADVVGSYIYVVAVGASLRSSVAAVVDLRSYVVDVVVVAAGAVAAGVAEHSCGVDVGAVGVVWVHGRDYSSYVADAAVGGVMTSSDSCSSTSVGIL